MKKTLSLLMGLGFIANAALAQDLKSKDVPAVVKSALASKYPTASKVNWAKAKIFN